jgi:hypothetical protein
VKGFNSRQKMNIFGQKGVAKRYAKAMQKGDAKRERNLSNVLCQ